MCIVFSGVVACVLRALVYPKKTPVDHDAHWTKCACRRGDARSCVVHAKRSVKTCVCGSNAVSKQSQTKSRPDVGGAVTDDVIRTSASGDSCQSSCAVGPTPSSDSLSRVYAVEDFHVPPSSAETPVASAAARDDRTSAEAGGDTIGSGVSDQSTELLTAAHCPDAAGDNTTAVSDSATPTSDSSTTASDSATAASDRTTAASDSSTAASDSATPTDQPTTTAAAVVPARANTRPASYWHVPPKCIFRPMTEVTAPGVR